MFTYEGANITDQQKGILDGLNKIRQEELDYNANERAKREEMADSLRMKKTITSWEPKMADSRVRSTLTQREKIAQDLSKTINR
jgi:hypothetical protein